ncbi:hypothetical protein [uncultured Nostoc sp.]|uniref:hypothetical protein n=1 Tax=uncultured Nostoc sp. TaxID=340711 RepID=UPI0035CBF25F
MISTLVFEELAIAILINNHNPSILTLDFLQYSGIVPSNWELAESPILNSEMARIRFTNDTIISTQYDRIVFSQTIEDKIFEDVQIPKIVNKYIETLPNADYQGVGINPNCFITFQDETEELFRYYITTNLLSSGNWRFFGKEAVIATLELGYTLEQGKFNLKIEDVRLRQTDNKPKCGALFYGNFPYEIVGKTSLEEQQYLYQVLDNCQTDLKTFRELVNQEFLGNK